MRRRQTWFVRKESKDGLSLPAWGECHSLIHAPSGEIDDVDSVWVGFFIDKKVAEKVKSILDNK